MQPALLSSERALIFRITHIDNVGWILDSGIHCRSSSIGDLSFREIGNRDLILRRSNHPVPCDPGGTLSDYVPFYFTPWSPMQLNIVTGYGGVPQTPAEDLVFLVSSVPRLDELKIDYLLTDRHAYLQAARLSTDASGLANVDWRILQDKDFKRSDEDPGKVERYQAEALVHRHVPVDALLGLAVHGKAQEDRLRLELRQRGLALHLTVRTECYFR